MSDDSLSQEDIDALVNDGDPLEPVAEEPAVAPEGEAEVEAAPEAEALEQADADPAPELETADAAEAPDTAETAEAAPEGADVDESAAAPGEALTEMERDTIGEVGNICMSSAATALSALLSRPVQITTPEVGVVDEDDVRTQFAAPAVVVVIEHTEGLPGRNVFVLSMRDASVVADLMMGGEGTTSDEIDEMHVSAVGEAMNQMMGSAATAMAEMLGYRVDISAPQVHVLDLRDEAFSSTLGFTGPLVQTSFTLRVGELLDTTLMQLMPMDFAHGLVEKLTSGGASAPAGAGAPADPAPHGAPPGAEPDDDRHLHSVPVPVAQPVTFPSLDEVPSSPGGSDISLLLDVPLQVTVELGRTQLRIRDVLELVPGSIVELDKLAGGPVDVLVNGKQIARGEVVVIDEEFGVRITDVASQAKRLRGLAAEGA